MRSLALTSAPALAPVLALLLACAGALPAPTAQGNGPLVIRPAELARVRCLLLAPIESATDAPSAAAAATGALAASVDPARTQVFPVSELRAMLADTPLELGEGVSGGTALELAELLGADGALYGTVEGRSRGRDPGLAVTLRLLLTPGRELVFAGSAFIEPSAGEPLDAAVRRAVVDLARPALDRLGALGVQGCFDRGRREALHAAAVALRPAQLQAPTPAVEPPPAAAPTLRTPRQRDWAKRLAERGRVTLDEVTFTGRTAELAREVGLADLALVLAASPALTVRLTGFVDASGDPFIDSRLSLSMAQAAARRLAELGIEPGRVSAAGRGGESPVVPNFTARGRAANRRLEASAPR
jgi:outer membrane protein OmpA-like peptidoglycan-associated protein